MQEKINTLESSEEEDRKRIKYMKNIVEVIKKILKQEFLEHRTSLCIKIFKNKY